MSLFSSHIIVFRFGLHKYKPIYLILRPCLVSECAFVPRLISMMPFETSVERTWGSNNAKSLLKLLNYLLRGHVSISAFIK